MNFSESHPMTLFIYFAVVICFVIFYRNPIFWIICLIISLIYKCIREKSFRLLSDIFFYAVLTAVITIAVSFTFHNGKSVMFFINDNAFTKEAVFMGFCRGIQLSAALCWLGRMGEVMSGEKVIYLVSGLSSRLAVFVSRIMRIIPMIKKQFLDIYKAQLRLHSGFLTIKNRIRVTAVSISALTTWVTENTADVSDAMYARGYGLSKRTSFSTYSFGKIDKVVVIMLIYTIPFTVATAVLGDASVLFFPETALPELSLTNLLIYIIWTALLIMPCITEICEDYKWKLLRSKI